MASLYHLGTSLSCNIEIPLLLAQSLTGVAVFPAPFYYLRSDNEGERGGVYQQRWPLEERGDGVLGCVVHSLRLLPVETGERTTTKMAA